MKISQEIHTKIDQKPLRKVETSRQNFDQIVQSHTQKLKDQELEKLIQDITKQGEKLVRFRSFRDLAKFKRLIKQFLEETVYNGYRLNESRNFNMNSYSHKLTTVKKIDEKLVQLTEDLLDQEKKTVDLLGLIGEIRGLLINLYT